MGSTVTTLPEIDAEGFAQRMAAVYPHGWGSNDALFTIDGVVNNVLKMIGSPLSFVLDESFVYALDAMRIGTALNDALDLASLDFFGPYPGQWALPRLPGETDAAFAARLLAAMLPTGATRAAVIAAIEKVTGSIPRVIEPWRPSDTGVLDGGPGQGMMFWDVDNAKTPFIWTNTGLDHQGFVQFDLPSTSPFGNTPTPCYDVPTVFYWNVPNARGAWFIDPLPQSAIGIDDVGNAITRTKVFGTIVWAKTKFRQAVIYGCLCDELANDSVIDLGSVADPIITHACNLGQVFSLPTVFYDMGTIVSDPAIFVVNTNLTIHDPGVYVVMVAGVTLTLSSGTPGIIFIKDQTGAANPSITISGTIDGNPSGFVMTYQDSSITLVWNQAEGTWLRL